MMDGCQGNERANEGKARTAIRFGHCSSSKVVSEGRELIALRFEHSCSFKVVSKGNELTETKSEHCSTCRSSCDGRAPRNKFTQTNTATKGTNVQVTNSRGNAGIIVI